MRFFTNASSVTLIELTRHLSEVGMQDRKGAGRGASAFTRAQARKALDQTLKRPTISAEDIMFLNERALDAVFNELILLAVGSNEFLIDQLLADKIDPETLRTACEAARKKLIEKSGPDPDAAMYACTEDLCHLFEIITGNPVTLSNKEPCGSYKQTPASDSAQFVREALILITGRSNEERGRKAKSAATRCIEAYISNRSKRLVHTRRTTALH